MDPNGLLVLGASGFVGRSLLKRLERQGRKIYSISRFVDGLSSKHVTVYKSSIDDSKLLEKILPKCSTVIHLASDTTPGSSALQPSVEADLNLLPTLRFLECLQDHSSIHLIFVSSGGTVYGTQPNDLFTENVALFPNSYYGAGKVSIEKFIFAYSSQTKASATILRPSNFYGPGQPYKKGFGIVPTIFHKILKNDTLQIWGDGEIIRDYLYIEDFIDLCEELLERTESSIPNGVSVFNVGSGVGTSLNDLCGIIENVTNRSVKRQYLPGRNVDVRHIILDSTLVKESFRWKPSTSLNEGLKSTWVWFQKNNS